MRLHLNSLRRFHVGAALAMCCLALLLANNTQAIGIGCCPSMKAGCANRACDAGCRDNDCCHNASACGNCQEPTWVTETRTVKQTVYKTVKRKVQVTVLRDVPEICDVTEEYLENIYYPSTELVPEPVVHTVHGMELRPVTTMVSTATARGTRKVISWYPCSVPAKVPVDYGHYELVPCELGDECDLPGCCQHRPCHHAGCQQHAVATTVVSRSRGFHGGCGSCGGRSARTQVFDFPCGGCGSYEDCHGQVGCDGCAGPHGCCHGEPFHAPHMKRVWVPDIHYVDASVTIMKAHVSEKINDPVRLVHPVTTFVAIPTREHVVDTKFRERTFIQAIPVTKVRTRKALKYRQVPEVVTKTVIDVVPEVVEKEVEVRVCKMLPQ